jgi:phosphopantetheinyl transferase (holo-ACP synthase)
MPVVFEKIENDVHLIVYEIEHDENFYKQGIDFTDFDSLELSKIVNPTKRLQWLASRFWVKKLSNQQQQLFLEKTELGKPHIVNYPIKFSISHSRNLVAVICSNTQDVAIDIETIQDKVLKIKHKFIHPKDFEQGENLQHLAMIWSAKETIYKHCHTKELYSFKEQIAIESYTDFSMNYNLSNFQNQKNSEVFYKEIDEAILTWIIE